MPETRKYGIIELPTTVGEAHVNVQSLDGSIVNAQARKRGLTALTFVTDAISTGEIVLGEGRVGLVVWFDRPAFDAARKVLAPSTEDSR